MLPQVVDLWAARPTSRHVDEVAYALRAIVLPTGPLPDTAWAHRTQVALADLKATSLRKAVGFRCRQRLVAPTGAR
jgi:hypothetical protein